jgi:cell division septation protein DedD
MMAATLIAAVACVASDAAAQSTQSVTLEYEQVATRMMPGATAALSLDASRVGASVRDGLVTLIGHGPGSTNVVVVSGDETITLRVDVGEPPVTVLPGMRTSNGRSGGSGYYEAGYGSDRGMLHGRLFFSRRDGERSAELTLGGAAPLRDDISSPFSIPQASLTLRTPGRELTLLDRTISNSPLTVSHANVRGLYLRQGPWQVNAGYSFFSTFEHLLLPTDKEFVTGVAYHRALTPRSSLTPNVFYFDGPVESRRGVLGTLLYELRTPSDLRIAAELAGSRSLGAALEIDSDRPNRRAWAKVRLAPSDLPSLTTDQQGGRHIEGGWLRQGDQSTLNASFSSRRYSQGSFDQASTVASLELQRRLTPHWAIRGGSGVSIFDSTSPATSRISNLTLPLGASFSKAHAGAGVDYQFSRETERDLGGHLFRVNLSGAARGFRLSGFGERQTQAPTARQIFTEIPWLQPMLDRLGLAANTPQQLADLLRANAELSAHGYANSIQLDITPVRSRLGATVAWSGTTAQRPQFSLSTLFNRDAAVDRTSSGAVHSMSYSQRLDDATEMFFTWSTLCHDHFISSACRPMMLASLRRALNRGPGFLAPRGGRIDGVVFKDDKALGVYTSDLPPLAEVDVILDNQQYTRTDALGRFRFDNVPYGRHRVEARYSSRQPTFFTTPSPADVETGSSVHFGVAPSRSSLRGVVLADGGSGINGVLVQVVSGEHRTTARTADDGSFVMEGLAPGDYDVSIDAASVPAGYPLDRVAEQRVRVEETEPGRARFVLRPYRSVAGRARVFDWTRGQYVALAGATVELLPVGQTSVTDSQGRYAFRNLPAGHYTIATKEDGREDSAAVTLPEGPAIVKDVELTVVPAAAAVASANSLGAAKAAQPPSPAPLLDEVVQAIAPAKVNGAGSSAASGMFTIAVAESSNPRHARALVKELKGAGHAAYLETAVSSRNVPYRVRVGHYSSATEAERSARLLERALRWHVSVTTVSSQSVARGITASDIQ